MQHYTKVPVPNHLTVKKLNLPHQLNSSCSPSASKTTITTPLADSCKAQLGASHLKVPISTKIAKMVVANNQQQTTATSNAANTTRSNASAQTQRQQTLPKQSVSTTPAMSKSKSNQLFKQPAGGATAKQSGKNKANAKATTQRKQY